MLSVRLGISLGETPVGRSCLQLNQSEVALHHAKRQQFAVAFYTPPMAGAAREMHQLENDLRVSMMKAHAALHSGEHNGHFELVYRPAVMVSTGDVVYYEVDIQWHHPTRGTLPSSAFATLADDLFLMDTLARWVFARACKEFSQHLAVSEQPRAMLAVTLPPSQLRHGYDAMQAINGALAGSAVQADRLIIEITESSAVEQRAAEIMSHLSRAGCKIALRDFGAGYSSLTQLAETPASYVSMTSHFMRDWQSGSSRERKQLEQLFAAMVALSSTFEFSLVVNGVDTQEQVDALSALSIHLQQGVAHGLPSTLVA